MMKIEPGFVPVIPKGSEGDWKCDGYSAKTKRFFQVYAPRHPNETEAIRKAKEDFEGALKKWEGMIKEWVFVYAHFEKLYPGFRSSMLKLAKEKGIEITEWNLEDIWQSMQTLPRDDRIMVLEMPGIFLDIDRRQLQEIQESITDIKRNLRTINASSSGDSSDKKMETVSYALSAMASTPSHRVPISENGKEKDAFTWFLFDRNDDLDEYFQTASERINEYYDETSKYGANEIFSWLHRTRERLLDGYFQPECVELEITTQILAPLSSSFEFNIPLRGVQEKHWLVQSLVGVLGKHPEHILESSPVVKTGSISIPDVRKPSIKLVIELEESWKGFIEGDKFLFNIHSTRVLLREHCTPKGHRIISVLVKAILGNFEQVVQVAGPNRLTLADGTPSNIEFLDVGWNGDGLELRFWISVSDPDECPKDCSDCRLYLKTCFNPHYWESANIDDFCDIHSVSLYLPQDEAAEFEYLYRKELGDTYKVLSSKNDRLTLERFGRLVEDGERSLENLTKKLWEYLPRAHLLNQGERKKVTEIAHRVKNYVEKGARISHPFEFSFSPSFLTSDSVIELMREYDFEI